MTQTPLERAARALCVRNEGNELSWDWWLDDARTVLLAIREPSEAMHSNVDAMLHADGAYMDCSDTAVWQAMIDAALGE